MKGKISTKAIIITILTVVLLAIATTGTILFLKDSGEASAMEEQNTVTTLPVAGADNQTETNVEQTVINEGENPQIAGGTEQTATEQQTGEVEQNENQAEGTGNRFTTQNTGVITEEPEPSTVEQERVISEETTLGWNNLLVSTGEANYKEKEINYNNLKYTVEYYFDGQIDGELTDIVEKNQKGKIIDTYADKNKIGYKLDEIENLPLTISENQEKNIIKIYYVKDSFGYTVNYYKDSKTEENFIAAETGTAKYESTVTADVTLHKPTGYKYEETVPSITIDTENNVIDVIYVKDSFGYTVNYYYDENTQPDESDSYNSSAVYGTNVTYSKSKVKSGYKVDKVKVNSKEQADINNVSMTITAGDNIIDVYCVREEYTLTIKYVYENKSTAADTYTRSIKYKDSYNVESPLIAGYNPDKGTVSGTMPATNLEVEVVYTPRTDLSYTIQYYYNGKQVDAVKNEIIGDQQYNKEIPIEDLKIVDKSTENGGDWTLDEVETSTTPFIIKETGNIVKVKYVKPIITSTKKAVKPDATTSAEMTTATAGDIIQYNITLKNDGGADEKVNIHDEIPTGTTYVDKSVTEGGKLNKEKTNIIWKNIIVPKYSEVTVSFRVRVNSDTKIGTVIENQATIKDKDDNNIIDKPKSGNITAVNTLKVTASNLITVDKTNVVLVLDISSSMEEKINGTKKIDLAKNTIKKFVEKLYSANADVPARVSIVVFASQKDIKTITFANGTKISSNKQEIISAINSISVPDRFLGTATCVGGALDETLIAVKNLKNADNKNADNKNIVIFLGDGEPTGSGNSNIDKKAEAIKEIANTKLYTIAFNMGDSSLLREISNGEGYYFTADNESELIANYTNILSNEGTSTSSNKTSDEEGKVEISLGSNTLKYPLRIKVNGVETPFTSETTLPSNIVVADGKITWDVSGYTVGTELELIYQVN